MQVDLGTLVVIVALAAASPLIVEVVPRMPLFLAVFLVVRGLPSLVIYRSAPAARDRVALGLYASTALPLVVAVTTLGVKDGEMRASTAAGLVGAAMLSVMVFPLSANAIRRRGSAAEPAS